MPTPRRPLILLFFLLTAACDGDSPSPLAPELPPPPSRAAPHADQALFLEAARTAWTQVDRFYRAETGLVDAVNDYPFATLWDIASGLAALYCANQLGLLPDADYDVRMGRALRTLQTMELFQGTTFDRSYSTRSGAVARGGVELGAGEPGSGWSATDLGRLLVWLKIIEQNHPRFRADVRRIVQRIDFAPILDQGYLWGAERPVGGETRRYQEGRIGYEQYAAYGFALWGKRAERALRLHENTLPITVMDVPLHADRRGHDLLTSEPFVLAGLEVGWTAEMRDLAQRLLRVQEERYRRTGLVTIVSEDAILQPPHYFYYYVVNFHGSSFVVLPPDSEQTLDWPRWVSTKAAFGWHALLPGGYTHLALLAVAGAREPQGWSPGVYEGTGRPTGGSSINTASVILEAALFSTTGRPLAYGR